jgi:hemerythrin superfamily protein
MDAIALLRQDHREVERLFKQFEKAGPRAHKSKRNLADKVIKELSVHAAIEEQVFYPAVREAVEETEDTVLESLEEHHIVKWTLSELDGMDPEAERFVPKMTVLIESVRHHVEEEEDELFPKVREALSRKQLAEIGEAMEKAKKAAPTRPHPHAPDTPPGNLVAGPGAAVLDKARDAVKQGKKSAVKKRAAKSRS